MTAHGVPWSDFELQCLYDVFNDLDWFERVGHLFEYRSEGAIRTKMSLLRSEAGVVLQRRGPTALAPSVVERVQAECASGALLRAIAAARRPAPTPPLYPDEVQLAMFDGPLFDWRPTELAA